MAMKPLVRLLTGVVLAQVLLLAAGAALVLPLFGGIDEREHLQYAAFMAYEQTFLAGLIVQVGLALNANRVLVATQGRHLLVLMLPGAVALAAGLACLPAPKGSPAAAILPLAAFRTGSWRVRLLDIAGQDVTQHFQLLSRSVPVSVEQGRLVLNVATIPGRPGKGLEIRFTGSRKVLLDRLQGSADMPFVFPLKL